MNIMKSLTLALALVLTLSLPLCLGTATALAQDTDEELAPGYNLCMEKAYSTVEMIDCAGTAYEYWEKELNKQYSEVQKVVNNDMLKTMQESWITYRNTMADIKADPENGTIGQVIALDFMASETKKQAELLKSLLPESF